MNQQTSFFQNQRFITTKMGQVERVEHKGVCTLLDACGVCPMLDLPYKNQLAQKTQQLKTLFQSEGGLFSHVPVKDCIGSTEHLGWRHVARFDVSESKDKKGRRWIDVGFTPLRNETVARREERRVHNAVGGTQATQQRCHGFISERGRSQVVDIGRCPIQTNGLNDMVAWIRTGIRLHDISVHSPRNREGLLQSVLIKSTQFTKQSFVTFIVTRKDMPPLRALARDIAEKFTHVNGVFIQVVSKDKKIQDAPILIVGKNEIEEKYGNIIFKFSNEVNLPPHPSMTWQVYSGIEKICDLTGKETVVLVKQGKFDVLTQLLARRSKKVIEVDGSLSSEQSPILSEKGALGKTIDAVVINAQHASYSEKMLKSLVSLSAQKIIYHSFSSKNIMDDLKFLTNSGYNPVFAELYDSAPGTKHFDMVCYLER